MLKWIRSIDWAAIAGSALVLAFCLMVLVPLAKQPVEKQSPQSEHGQSYKKGFPSFFGAIGGWVDRNHDNINAGSTLAIALLTIALVYVGYSQSRRLRDTIEQMKATEERELRAYIFVDNVTIENGPNATWTATVTIRNFGKTPAYSAKIRAEGAVREKEDAIKIIPRSDEHFVRQETIIPPGHPFIAVVDLQELPVDIHYWYKVLGSTKLPFVWGRVDYVDAFGRPRWTQFQLIHLHGYLTFAFCAVGNEADH
ncbi:MAG: hypothetical protein ACREHE_01070 [Rhizomicrobium sp.]